MHGGGWMLGAAGYDVPPGISDATVPNPIFSLLPSATVDEGNNGSTSPSGRCRRLIRVTGLVLGNYAPGDRFLRPSITSRPHPRAGPSGSADDFFGNPRPDADSRIDVGAIEHNTALPVT